MVPIQTLYDKFYGLFYKNFTTTKVESFVSDDERIRWGVERKRDDSSYYWLKYGHMTYWIWNQGFDKLKNISELYLHKIQYKKMMKDGKSIKIG